MSGASHRSRALARGITWFFKRHRTDFFSERTRDGLMDGDGAVNTSAMLACRLLCSGGPAQRAAQAKPSAVRLQEPTAHHARGSRFRKPRRRAAVRHFGPSGNTHGSHARKRVWPLPVLIQSSVLCPVAHVGEYHHGPRRRRSRRLQIRVTTRDCEPAELARIAAPGVRASVLRAERDRAEQER